MILLIIGLAGLFGLAVGSFLNVVIYRLDQKEKHRMFSRTSGVGILQGRSFCPHCNVALKWYELIPVLSFIIQKRKCNSCGKPISWRYPLVELGTALIFVLITLQYLSGAISLP